MKTLDLRSAAAWRRWLAKHHASEAEVWLVFHKRHTGRRTIAYPDSVNEALCYGWIDSLVKRLDDDRYARKFTPRKPGSRWSTANRRRYAKLAADGRLAQPGKDRAPTNRSGDAPRPLATSVPRYITAALRTRPKAFKNFESLASSYRRLFVAWIDSAKREETRHRRLQEALALLDAGKKLGLK